MSRTTFRGGVHPAENKGYTRDIPLRVVLPKGELIYPLNMHLGKPADALVKKGDKVLVGQIIGQASGFISANVISSCSGTVKALEQRQTSAGTKTMCIVVESDGEFTPIEGYGTKVDYTKLSAQEIVDRVKAAGVVGMGGAQFPTHVKLMPKNADEIKYFIANGAECEPYITCDDQLMRTKADEIVGGMKIGLQLFKNAKGVILIEKNKPEAIKAMQEACAKESNISVMPVQTKYPQGGERTIVQMVSGKHLRLGMLPADCGCVVDNVATVRAIYRAVCHTEALTERGMTVSGDIVKQPGNFMFKIGMTYAEVLEAAGGIKEGAEIKKALAGGPMMGVAMSSLDVPAVKASNALTLLGTDPVEEAEKQMTACIRCGRCAMACSLGLNPQMMADAAKRQDYERYEKTLYGLECVQCGACTFICPAKRPLMQLFKLTKAEIMAAKKK